MSTMKPLLPSTSFSSLSSLRCSVGWMSGSRLQRRLDRELKEIDGDRGFMTDMEIERDSGSQDLYVVCRE